MTSISPKPPTRPKATTNCDVCSGSFSITVKGYKIGCPKCVGYLSSDGTVKNAVVIYGLIDPNTKELRYVGKTDCLRARIKGHYSSQELNDGKDKSNWLLSLVNNGQRAEIIIIEDNVIDNYKEAERYWIQYFQAQGAKLTNQMSMSRELKISLLPDLEDEK